MNKKITKKELRSVFWRSFALQGAFNYEKMQNIGYAFSMEPIIKNYIRIRMIRQRPLKDI
ncbi:PTS system mannose/fructose/sorbose IID component family protein [Companilactobacillus farciminis]|nr:PTS system mannose/fructose/sorbose IID component family protein [Companilactobacillus farciminis]